MRRLVLPQVAIRVCGKVLISFTSQVGLMGNVISDRIQQEIHIRVDVFAVYVKRLSIDILGEVPQVFLANKTHRGLRDGCMDSRTRYSPL